MHVLGATEAWPGANYQWEDSMRVVTLGFRLVSLHRHPTHSQGTRVALSWVEVGYRWVDSLRTGTSPLPPVNHIVHL